MLVKADITFSEHRGFNLNSNPVIGTFDETAQANSVTAKDNFQQIVRHKMFALFSYTWCWTYVVEKPLYINEDVEFGRANLTPNAFCSHIVRSPRYRGLDPWFIDYACIERRIVASRYSTHSSSSECIDLAFMVYADVSTSEADCFTTKWSVSHSYAMYYIQLTLFYVYPYR